MALSRLSFLRLLLRRPASSSQYRLVTADSQQTVDPAADEEPQEDRKTSKAMMAYMERASAHKEFMKKQEQEFAVGKRHLANMMGEDPENFTQADIDRAIAYLFPTGIFDKKARPRMRPPNEVFPQQKEAQFDESGRPHHSLFYTLVPNFFQTLHTVTDKINQLYKLEDRNLKQGQKPDPDQKLNMLGSDWINHQELNLRMVEKLNTYQYDEFVRAMNRLVEHPLSYIHKDFIFSFRKQQKASTEVDVIPELQFDTDGRPFQRATGYRKKAVAEVTVYGRGSGRVMVNGMPLVQYFWRGRTGYLARNGDQEVSQIMYPLQVTGMLDSVDIEAQVKHFDVQLLDWRGDPLPVQAPTAQAGAIRHGVSLALRSFVDKDMVETMRLAGLLQRDVRKRERKKVGKRGARRGRTWKKR